MERYRGMNHNQKVNPRKICFIICANNELYLEECLYYIAQLRVPVGYQVESLSVRDAKSMTAGYNEAMQSTDAKYKVYLHQDVFIINPNFIFDCLEIFEKDSTIAMIGNVGIQKLPDSAVMWEGKRVGKLYEQHIFETVLSGGDNDSKDLIEVEVIDGFIMITQYDLPWREDIFTHWDFYDCSQSLEFIRKGYKVIVPKMESPWCLHDSGFLNLIYYEEERKKFIKEYKVEKR